MRTSANWLGQMAMSKSGDLNLIWWNLERSLLQLAVHPARRYRSPEEFEQHAEGLAESRSATVKASEASNIAASIEGLA